MRRAFLLAALGALLAGCGSSSSPRPDLVFVSSRDGAYQLYGMSADGSHQRRLTHDQGDPSTPRGLFYQVDPAWSPDGTLIAFSSRRDGHAHLFVMKADGTGTRRLTDTAHDDGHPSWSPDGKRIVFRRGAPGDLYVMPSAGGPARRLGEDAADEGDPAWSPTGHWIVYVRRTPGTKARELWLVRPDGSGRHELTRFGASSLEPAWSPDGAGIAFSSDRRVPGTFELYALGLDGRHLRALTLSGAGSFEPSWSPDGKSVAFWSGGAIYVLDVGGGQEQLTNGKGNDSSPVWRPVQPATS